MNSRNSIPPTLPLPLPWCKFPTNLLNACKNQKIPSDRDKRAMIATIASYMVDDLKDTRAGIARLVVRSICNKYPLSFAVRIGDNVINDGVEQMVVSIGNRITYIQNLDRNEQGQKAPPEQTSTPSSSSARDSHKVILDAYGTVAYQPGLPPEETEQTQAEKQKFLLEEFSKMVGQDDTKISNALKATFPTQRLAINGRGLKTVSEVLNDWPFLRQPQYFLKHSSELFGRESIFSDFTENIARYFRMHQWMAADINDKIKKNKNKINEKLTEKLNKLSDILTDSARATKSLNEAFPKAIGLFALIIEHFEESNLIYKLVEKTTSDDDILQLIEGPTPTAIIKGESLYAKDVDCIIIVEGQICFRCHKVVTAILMTFLCYFVFGLKYPKGCCKSLEFIQRAFLGINAPGCKDVTGVKRKRKAQEVNPGVKKLCATLEQFWVPKLKEKPQLQL